MTGQQDSEVLQKRAERFKNSSSSGEALEARKKRFGSVVSSSNKVFVFVPVFVSVSVFVSVPIFVSVSVFVSVPIFVSVSVFVSVPIFVSVSVCVCPRLCVCSCLCVCLSFLSLFVSHMLLTSHGVSNVYVDVKVSALPQESMEVMKAKRAKRFALST